MHLPGFAAEASLYKTDACYHMGRAGSWGPQGFSQIVSSQLLEPIPNPWSRIPVSLVLDLWSRIPNCGPDGVLICFRGRCFCA